MANRETKGGYTGGGTIVSPRKDPSWFSKNSTRIPKDLQLKNCVGVKPGRTPAEQLEFEAFEREQRGGSVLVKRRVDQPPKKQMPKSIRCGLMAYETGMSISWTNGECVVFFRGEKHLLPGKFASYDAARLAGEAFCRKLGWKG
jgi:hypothetical protein